MKKATTTAKKKGVTMKGAKKTAKKNTKGTAKTNAKGSAKKATNAKKITKATKQTTKATKMGKAKTAVKAKMTGAKLKVTKTGAKLKLTRSATKTNAKLKAKKTVTTNTQEATKSPIKIKMSQVTTMPELTLAATGGQMINLKELAGKKVVLYFYPKDMTPGCTIEGHDFTKLKAEFENQNTVIFGVSRDTVELHEKFKAKECYTIDLLADTEEKLCKTFDVIKDKNMYGKKVRGIERSTFVIDENGQIIKEWRGVKVEGHAQEVLDFLVNWTPTNNPSTTDTDTTQKNWA